VRPEQPEALALSTYSDNVSWLYGRKDCELLGDKCRADRTGKERVGIGRLADRGEQGFERLGGFAGASALSRRILAFLLEQI
jgi:hypothetical protein